MSLNINYRLYKDKIGIDIMKEITIQVKFVDGGAKSVTKTYNGIKSDITLEQTANLAKFFQQLTNDMVVSAYRLTKEEAEIDD